MRMAFVVLCIVCSALLNVIVFAVVTGNIPFRKPVEPGLTLTEKVTRSDTAMTAVADNDRKSINELIKAFDVERAALDAQRADLKVREEGVSMKEVALASLRTEVEGLQKNLEVHILEVKTTQQTNLRRLAEMYAKMDPASASLLLKEMDRNHAATILSMTTDRSAAAIMDATIQAAASNAVIVAAWSEIIRSLKVEKTAKAKG